MRFLLSPIGNEHFQPVSRLFGWLAATPLSRHYGLAAGLLAVVTGISAGLLVRLLDELFGSRSLHLIAGFAFGTSWIFLNTNQWYSGADAVPAVMFMLAATVAWLRWLDTDNPAVYVVSLACATLGVLTWEQALLTPMWLLLLWVCFGWDRSQLRRVVVSIIPFLGVCGAFTLYVQSRTWHQRLQHPTALQWIKLALVMVFHAVVPAAIGTGLRNGTPSDWGWASIAIVSAGVLAASAWLIARGRFRWSALAFLVIGTALVVTTVATTRINIGASAAGNTPRYLVFLLPVAAVGVCAAIKARPTSAHLVTSHTPGRRPTAVIAAFGVVVISLYLLNLSRTFDSITFSRDFAHAAAPVSARIDHGIALSISHHLGLVDSDTPFPIWYPGGGGDLVAIGDYWRPQLQPFGQGPQLAAFDATMTLRRAVFLPATTGGYVRFVVTATRQSKVIVTVNAGSPTGQPEVPWNISVPPGSESYVLPTWGSGPATVKVVSGPGVSVANEEVGVLTLGQPVSPT